MSEQIRNMAHFLWEQAGRPDGRSEEFWLAAEKIQQNINYWQRYEDYEPKSSEMDQALWAVVLDALKDCIDAHGPIAKQSVNSAAKRIIIGIIDNEQFRTYCPDYIYYPMIIDSMEYYFNQKFWRMENHYKNVIKKLKANARLKITTDQLVKKNKQLTDYNNEIQILKNEVARLNREISELKSQELKNVS